MDRQAVQIFFESACSSDEACRASPRANACRADMHIMCHDARFCEEPDESAVRNHQDSNRQPESRLPMQTERHHVASSALNLS